MAIQRDAVQTASDVTLFLEATLPPILSAFGLAELVPLVGAGVALEKLVAGLIEQKQAAFNAPVAVVSAEVEALADLNVKFPDKP